MFAKTMSARAGQRVFVNRLLEVNLEVVNSRGQRIIKPFSLIYLVRWSHRQICDFVFHARYCGRDELDQSLTMGYDCLLDSTVTPLIFPLVDCSNYT